jgi:hypothetical protein
MNPKLLLALIGCSAGLVPLSAPAQSVGVVGAVNPASLGAPPGAAPRTLNLGQQIIFREKITTTASGSVQLAFLDKSTLTVGANSNVIIDEYVFNPATDTGKMTVSVAKGVMRFVGGQISHGGNAQIKTPTATIGLRGAAGSVTVGADGATTYNHHFGRATVQTGAGVQVVARPGFSVTAASANTPPSAPARTPQSNIDQVTTATLSKPTQTGGSTQAPTDTQAQSRLGTTQIGTDPTRSVPVQSSTATSVRSTTAEVAALTSGSQTARVIQNATTAAAVDQVSARVAAPRAFTLMTRSSTGALPYLSALFVGPNAGSTVMTPILAYRAGGSAADSERSSFMQVSLSINGQGRNQTSQMVVASGALYQRGGVGGPYEMAGGFSGSTRNDANGNTGHTRGAMTSVPGGIALDQDQIPTSVTFDQNQINRSTGQRYSALARVGGSIVPVTGNVDYTYNATATQAASASALGSNRPAATLSGFAAGIFQFSRWADDTDNSLLQTRSYAPIRSSGAPSDVLITLDPSTSRAFANIKVVQTGSFTTLREANYEFGGLEANGRARSAYIDINNFALRSRVSDVNVETDQTRTTSTYRSTSGSGTYGGSTATGGAGAGDLSLLTWDTIAQQDPTAGARFFPGTNLCACEYTKWGFWSANMGRYTGVGTQVESERGNLLLWVAGQLAGPSSIPTSGIATYNGHAIANIYENLGTRYQYIAAGNFSSTVNFGTRTNSLTISNLDGLTYNGVGSINPTTGVFQGTISSGPAGAYGTVSGPLVGAFYGSGATTPQEVAGQFNTFSSATDGGGGNRYFASGIFLGRR